MELRRSRWPFTFEGGGEGSFGATESPENWGEKFPSPEVFLFIYLRCVDRIYFQSTAVSRVFPCCSPIVHESRAVTRARQEEQARVGGSLFFSLLAGGAEFKLVRGLPAICSALIKLEELASLLWGESWCERK